MASAELAPPFGLTGFRRALAIAAAAFVLTAFFFIVGFPYDRLAPRVAAAIQSTTGLPVTIGQLGFGLVLVAPQFRAWDVGVPLPDGKHVHFDRVRLQPAWSLSWLRGDPAVTIALRSELGELDGTVVTGAEPSFEGEFRMVALSMLPLGGLAAGTQLEGSGDAQIDLTRSEAGLQGTVRVAAKDGSLTMPLLPIGIPFDTLTGDVALGGDTVATLNALDLAGPLITLTASGSVGRGATTELSPLSLKARIEAREPAVRMMLESQGVPLDASGGAAVDIGGTLGNPEIVPARGAGRAG